MLLLQNLTIPRTSSAAASLLLTNLLFTMAINKHTVDKIVHGQKIEMFHFPY